MSDSTQEPLTQDAPESSVALLGLIAEINEKLPPLKERIRAAADLAALEELRVAILGKKGVLTDLNARMGPLSPAEKPIAGKNINNHKAALLHTFKERKEELEAADLQARLVAESVDVTVPGVRPRAGHRHPVAQTMDEMIEIFRSMGFAVASGPEIENEWFNFEALNIAADHPARDMQDTFYVDRGAVLRTHTSPTQIRVLRTMQPPFAVVTPGKVYRCDADATHSPMFFQMEGLLLDREVSMAHLKGVLNEFLRALFGKEVKTRFRPSFFPFTEPSAEVDVWYTFRRTENGQVIEKSGWMEVMGAGLVHPQVLENAGLNSRQWKGFAFGMGIDRLTMLKYGINDIRLLYQNDLRFLRQF